MDEAAGKNHPEFAGIRGLRSTGFLSCQIRAVEENVVPLIANPTMSPLSLIVLQQGGTVTMAPGTRRGPACLYVWSTGRREWYRLLMIGPPPTTLPRLLMLEAR